MFSSKSSSFWFWPIVTGWWINGREYYLTVRTQDEAGTSFDRGLEDSIHRMQKVTKYSRPFEQNRPKVIDYLSWGPWRMKSSLFDFNGISVFVHWKQWTCLTCLLHYEKAEQAISGNHSGRTRCLTSTKRLDRLSPSDFHSFSDGSNRDYGRIHENMETE